MQQGRLDVALACFEEAIAIRPDFIQALFSRGLLLRDQKRPAEALASLERALAIRPDFTDALNSRGVVLHDLNRPAEALASYEQALATKPDYAGAWYNRGSALRDLQRHAEALASYDRALALQPDMAEAWVGRGLLLSGYLERPDEALAAYDQALAIKPEIAEAWLHRGGVLQELKRPDEAIASYRQALAKGGDAEVIRYTLASLGAEAAPAIAPRQFIAQLFDQYADRFDDILVGALKYQAPDFLLDMIERFVPSRDLDVLDLGCGTGLVGSRLRPLAGTLTGVDVAARMIEMARKPRTFTTSSSAAS